MRVALVLSTAALILSTFAQADCSSSGNLCPKLSSASLKKLPAGVPPFIFDGSTTYYVEMRDGKAGSDCYGVTLYQKPMGIVILADNMSDWKLRETLLHESLHIAAHHRDDGKCKFKDEDQAIEHLAPGWTDLLHDSRNKQLVEFLTK